METENGDEIETKRTTLETERITRRNSNIHTFCHLCFFCEKNNAESNLHQCETLKVSKKVKEIAGDMGDAKLLAKFSEGDMVATEAKYHSKCLLDFYYRYEKSKKSETIEEASSNLIEGKCKIYTTH